MPAFGGAARTDPRAGGHEAQAQHAGHRVGLVRDGQDRARRATREWDRPSLPGGGARRSPRHTSGGQPSLRAYRPPMTPCSSVSLLDHLGGQIHLAQRRRLGHGVPRGGRLAQVLRQPDGQRLDAASPRAVTAQRLLEQDALQRRRALGQLSFRSLFQKNSASTSRALRTCSWPARISSFVGVHVDHGEEAGARLPVGSAERKVLLVVPHHGDQHLGGDGQEARSSKAPDTVGNSLRYTTCSSSPGSAVACSARLGFNPGDLGLNLFAAPAGVQDHAVPGQAALVVGEVRRSKAAAPRKRWPKVSSPAATPAT